MSAFSLSIAQRSGRTCTYTCCDTCSLHSHLHILLGHVILAWYDELQLLKGNHVCRSNTHPDMKTHVIERLATDLHMLPHKAFSFDTAHCQHSAAAIPAVTHALCILSCTFCLVIVAWYDHFHTASYALIERYNVHSAWVV